MILPDQAVILLVDDREDDIILITHALAKAEVHNPIFAVRSGNEAVAYLHGTGKYQNRDAYPLPDIMLLDLKMPGIDGFEVIREVRRHKDLCALRIIVLTSSDSFVDINNAYELGANSFLVKPLEFNDLTIMMRTLSAFWLRQSRSPSIHPPSKQTSKSKPATNHINIGPRSVGDDVRRL